MALAQARRASASPPSSSLRFARQARAGLGAGGARGGRLGLELVEPRGKLGRGCVGRAEAALEEVARTRASLGGSGAQVVELAAERGQAIAFGREASGRRVGLRLKFGERFARRLARGVEFLGARATLPRGERAHRAAGGRR